MVMNRLAALLLVSSCFLTACDSAEDRKEKYMSQGLQFIAEENWDKARVSLKNVLKIDPDDAAAHREYARVLQNGGDYRGALGHFNRAIELNPKDVQALVAVAKIYTLAAQLDHAMTHAQKALDISPDDASALAVKAAILVRQGDANGAMELVDRALRLAPHHIEATVLKVSLLSQRGEVDKAIEIAQEAGRAHPNDLTLMALLVQVYQGQQRHEEAEKVLADMVALAPDDWRRQKALLHFRMANNRGEAALDQVRTYLKAHADHVEAMLNEVAILRVTDKNAATVRLQEHIQSLPKAMELPFALAEYQLQDGHADAALALYDDIIEREVDSPWALKALNRQAEMALKSNQSDKAKMLLTRVLEKNPNDAQALTLRGMMALSQQDAANAISDFRSVLRDNPDNIAVARLLAQAHVLNREAALAIDQYRNIVTRDPKDVDSRLKLASLLEQRGDSKGAGEQLQLAARLAPDNTEVLQQSARVAVRDARWDDLQGIAAKLMAARETAAGGLYFLGLAEQGKGNHAQALKNFELSLQEQPEGIEPLGATVKTYLALNQADQAIVWLQKRLEQQPKQVILNNLLGEVYLQQGNYLRAAEQFRQAIEKAPTWWLPYRSLSATQLRQEKLPDAISTLRQGIEANGKADQLRVELAAMLERQGEYDQAIEQYEIMLKEPEATDVIKNNLAMLLVSYRTDEGSLKRAAELATQLRDSNHPMYLDTAAWVILKQGDHGQAISLLRRALDKMPESPVIQYHLAEAYYQAKDLNNARLTLDKALQGTQPFQGRKAAEQLLAKLNLDQGT